MRDHWAAILVMAGALALIPTAPPAQMGPGQGKGPGMRGGTGPDSNPRVMEREGSGNPKEPPPPDGPTAAGSSGMQGMTAVGMEHPAASAPFYRERTFLVLVGVAVSAVGFLAYRVARSRPPTRAASARFVTEAVLVVDLVGSTSLATHYGDALAMKARTALKERTLAAAAGRGLAFAENTGDGCLMTFPSAAGTVHTAIALLRDLRMRPPELSPAPPLEVRAGISYGEILLDGAGNRHGAVINRAFRLEGLTPDGFAQLEGGIEREAIPERSRIFLDEEAARELQPAGIPTRFVGVCSLKGFSGLHRVYEVLWGDAPMTGCASDLRERRRRVVATREFGDIPEETIDKTEVREGAG